jgi:hypothetical protein
MIALLEGSMKVRRSRVLDLIFLLILFGVIATGAAIGHLRYMYFPSVEHESAFSGIILRDLSWNHLLSSKTRLP